MQVVRITGDTVTFVFHTDEQVEVGQQFQITELPDRTDGLIVQTIGQESLMVEGVQAQIVQAELERRFTTAERVMDKEFGMAELKSLKLGTAKIRKHVRGDEWRAWSGWIPGRNVEVAPVGPDDLLDRIVLPSANPLRPFAKHHNKTVALHGRKLDKISVIVGAKGQGKSHAAKQIALSVAQKRVPVVIFDVNAEYGTLPGAQVLRWGKNYLPSLSELGPSILLSLVRSLQPLPLGSPSEATFDSKLPTFFQQAQEGVDIPYLMTQKFSETSAVNMAIQARLRRIDEMRLFAICGGKCATPNLSNLYENACNGDPIVFDLSGLRTGLQTALVKAMIKQVEHICEAEDASGEKRWPYLFFEEAHLYLSESAVVDLTTRPRHLGVASVFITNQPQAISYVFPHLDNLFLLGLRHADDVRAVSKVAFADAQTLEAFATRLPEHHMMILGNVTSGYPLIVSVDPLPDEMGQTGATKSTWSRFE